MRHGLPDFYFLMFMNKFVDLHLGFCVLFDLSSTTYTWIISAGSSKVLHWIRLNSDFGIQ